MARPLDPRSHASRRHFLAQQGMSLGGLALAWLLHRDGPSHAADKAPGPRKPDLERPVFDLRPKAPPRLPRARAMISLFMQGGPSHLDLFDPKPELQKRDGKTFAGLSEIATLITGTRWNGPRFFGLRASRSVDGGNAHAG